MNKYKLSKILLLCFVTLTFGFVPAEGDETPVALIKKIVNNAISTRRFDLEHRSIKFEVLECAHIIAEKNFHD